MKYLRKSDWGNYWASDIDFDHEKLIERSLSALAKFGIQLSGGSSNMELSKEIFDFFRPLAPSFAGSSFARPLVPRQQFPSPLVPKLQFGNKY